MLHHLMNLITYKVHACRILTLGFVVFFSNVGLSSSHVAANVLIANREYGQDWKVFSTSVGGFSILFPKVPSESSGTLNVGKMIVDTHTYSMRDDHTFTVMYFDAPHAKDPKAHEDLLLGFRNFVLAEFKAELVSDKPVSIDNNAGRLLEMSVSKRGIARALILVTESRLYRIAVVPETRGIPEANTRAVSTKFLESFRLSTIDSSGEGEVDAYLRRNPELAQRELTTDSSNSILNGRALQLPSPEYPALARAIHVSGTVTVKVIIDEEGKVIAAQAMGGHPLLQPAAVEAARKARFTTTLEQGKAVKVLGKVQYNFVSR
jgi:TonB family protein